MSDRRIYIAEKHDGNFHSGYGIWQEAEDGASPNFVGKISEVHDDHVIGRVNGDEPTRFDFVGERFDDVDDDRCQAIEKFVEQPAQPDRLYVVEERDGTFRVGHRIWKEAKTPQGLDGVGRITEVHEDYIVGRLDGNHEYVRFDFVGKRFRDSDDDISQAIERVVEQPAQPFAPIENETMFMTLKRDGSVHDGFSSVWQHSRDTNDKLMCVVAATIKRVNEDHIIVNFRDNGDVDVRLNITNNKFRDCNDDNAVEVIAVIVEEKTTPTLESEPTQQPDRIYIIEDGSTLNGFSGGFSANGYIWKADPDGGDAACVGQVKEVHSNYILGSLTNIDGCIRFDFVGGRFDDVDVERSQEVVRHVVQPAQLATQAPTVGQYVFEDGKFFGKVVKGDDEHIRIDGLGGKCWFNVNDDPVRLFKFHTIKPGMKAAPKTSGINFIIDSVVEEPYCGGKASPLVVFSDGRDILLSKLVQDYDLSVPPADQQMQPMSLDKVNPNIPLLSPDKYEISIGVDHAQPDQLQLPEHCVIGSAVYTVGADIDNENDDEGVIKEITPTHLIMAGWLSCGSDLVHLDTLTGGDVDLKRLADYKFRPAAECPECNSSKHWEPSRHRSRGTEYCARCDSFYTPAAQAAKVKPDSVISCAHFDSDGAISKEECKCPECWQAQEPAQPVVYDEYGLSLDVGYDIFYKISGELCGTVTELHPDNEITMKFKSGVTDDTVVDKPNIIPCYNPRIDAGDGQAWGFCPSNWGRNRDDRILRIDRLEAAEEANPEPHGRTGCRGAKEKLSPIQLSKRISEIADTVLPKYLPAAADKPKQPPQAEPRSETKQYCPQCEKLDRWQHSIRPKYGTDFCGACEIWWTSGDRNKPTISLKDLEPKLTEKKWVVDDEFETQIHVSDAVFLKETGKVIGHVTKLRDDNQLDIKFNPADVNLGSSLKYYNPRRTPIIGEGRFGFHRSGQFGSDLERTDYILGCNLIAHPEQSTKPGDGCRHGIPRSKWKICLRCNSSNEWYPSIRPEYGTDFCKKCKIWWTSGDIGKPIVDLKDLEPSSIKPAQQPAQPFPTAAHKKLQECGMNSVEAEGWLSRNRPPVDLQNGDTIVTNTGIYQLHDNKWVKVAGKLHVRCHESIVDDSRAVVEYKFVSDELLKLKDRDKDFEDATATVREVLEWGDTMLSDLRPKGKPLTTHNED